MVRELSVISLLLTFSLSPLKSAYTVYDYDYNYFKFVKVFFMARMQSILMKVPCESARSLHNLLLDKVFYEIH